MSDISELLLGIHDKYRELLDAHTRIQVSANGYVDENRALRQVLAAAEIFLEASGSLLGERFDLQKAVAEARPHLQVRP